MEFEPDRVTTLTVDSYGTLVDTTSAERALADRVANPEPISTLWRSRSLMYTMVANYTDSYQPFYEMNRDALTDALEAYGVSMSADERDEILSVYHDLDPFDDVRPGIERLRDGGYEVYVLSNGNPEMLSSMVETAGIGDLVEDTISAHEIETFKPHAEIYRHAAGRAGTPIREIAHVSGPAFDVQGAIHAGMQGIWLDRAGGSFGTFGEEPDLAATDFHDVAAALGV